MNQGTETANPTNDIVPGIVMDLNKNGTATVKSALIGAGNASRHCMDQKPKRHQKIEEATRACDSIHERCGTQGWHHAGTKSKVRSPCHSAADRRNQSDGRRL